MILADLEISPLDYHDFARALQKLAEQREKQAQTMKLGVKRDNLMARAIRLKRISAQLLEPAEST